MKSHPLILFLFCATLTGCNRNSPRPDDLPELSLCKITVTQNGVPLQDAEVAIFSKDTSAKYRNATGTTDTEGIAEMRTYGFSGVPVGTYKVTVKKTVLEGAKEYVDDYGATQVSGGKDYNFVNRRYLDEKTTDLEIEITAGKNEISVDVGKPVHELYQSGRIGYN
ncbi:MAG: carboxypeptidase-like regulatory domain-containing protein [Planctomycetaceae bacterium]|nr:carboxypeptidase-like regulatory domain-containing protein [Planctomycetaceae bacterium]